MTKKRVLDLFELTDTSKSKDWIERYEEEINKLRVEVEFHKRIQDELKTIITYCDQQDNEEVKVFANGISEKIKPLIKTK
ncbi:hypothetical protein [Bacillus pretiosus]|uniref:hypothetical protein n=1 Tax=Bacillus pretiosus TaxID=2983392 RepID=UPI003D64A073